MTIFHQVHKSYDECTPDTHVILMDPTHVELHLSHSPDLPRVFGKKVKAAGGTYTACRGHRRSRSVTLPFTPDTYALINVLVRAYGNRKTAMIALGTRVSGSMAWMNVHYVSREEQEPATVFLDRYWKAVQQAVDRGLCNIHEGEPPPVDELLYAQRRLAKAKERVRQMKEGLKEAEAAEHAAINEVWRLENLALIAGE